MTNILFFLFLLFLCRFNRNFLYLLYKESEFMVLYEGSIFFGIFFEGMGIFFFWTWIFLLPTKSISPPGHLSDVPIIGTATSHSQELPPCPPDKPSFPLTSIDHRLCCLVIYFYFYFSCSMVVFSFSRITCHSQDNFNCKQCTFTQHIVPRICTPPLFM